MAKNGKGVTKAGAAAPAKSNGKPASLAFADKGITTSRDFAGFMSALMSDLIVGRISPGVGNAACNAGGKLLKMVEMQHKYGKPHSGSADGPKDLLLAASQPTR